MTSRILALSAVGLGCASFGLGRPLYTDVSSSHLPLASTTLRSMDAEMGDFDNDGDLDVLVAMEFSKNLLLLNDGTGKFTDASDRLPEPVHDSEDIALSDFDGDGDLDAVVVSEDDKIDLYYINDGSARFTLGSLPPAEITNGVNKADFNWDGDYDLVLGNAGPNALWENRSGAFVLQSEALPTKTIISQDVQTGDLDGDGDMDIVEANEGPNRVLLNDGQGKFTELLNPFGDIRERESRQAAVGDVDGDGDLDVVIGNVALGYYGRSADNGVDLGYANRLFLNNGDATFSLSLDFPDEELQSLIVDFIDFDTDGDLDLLVGHVEDFRNPSHGRVRAYLNDGSGKFTDDTDAVFPETFAGNAWDTAVGDVNGDGKDDIYLANRHGEDRLILAR